MSPSRNVLVVVLALSSLSVLADPAAAKIKRHVTHSAPVHARAQNFPVYVDRGVDRNPGGDNLYFSDTKRPSYIVGPAWFQRWD